MKNISLDINKALGVITNEQITAQASNANACNTTLENGTGLGNDYLGWLVAS